MTLAGIVRRFRNRICLEIDLGRWAFRTRRFKYVVPPKPLERTVLFCDLMSGVSTAKVEALLAAVLRNHGYRTTVLLRRRSPIFERIFRAVGPARFIYLEKLLTPEIRKKARVRAGLLIEQMNDTASLLALEERGFRIGRNVLSLVLREVRSGKLDFNNASQKARTREVLAESLAVIAACDRLLDETAPDLAVFNERGYTPAGEVFDACHLRGIDTVQWLGAPQSDCLLFKRFSLANRGTHPLALSDETWIWLQRQPWTENAEKQLMEKLSSHYESGTWFNRQKLQEGKTIKTKEEVYAQLNLDPAKKTAVIFCHILYDATFFYGESLFSDYETWLVETVGAAIDNPALNWVVKAHPVNVWRSKSDGAAMEQLEAKALHAAFGELPDHVRFMPADTDINTFSLFGAIDYGLTVRGTIGMELPCFGIPVVTAGTGRYSGRGFTLDPSTAEAFRNLLRHLHEVPRLSADEISLARRYAYGTFFLRPVLMKSFRLDFHANSFNLTELATNVDLLQSNGKAFLAAPDIQAISRWMTDEQTLDMLADEAATFGETFPPHAHQNAGKHDFKHLAEEEL